MEIDKIFREFCAINATTILVELSNGSMHEVVLENGQELEVNKRTEVSFEIDGVYYTAFVIYTEKSADLEKEIEKAHEEFNQAVEDHAEAFKNRREAQMALREALRSDDEDEILTAQENLRLAQVKLNQADYRVTYAGEKLRETISNTYAAQDYEKALAAVEKAERSQKSVDVAAAQKLVDDLSGDIKTDLQNRLDEVSREIKAIKAVELAEKYAADEDEIIKNLRAAYNDEVTKVGKLEDGPTKTALEERLETVKAELDTRVKEWNEAKAAEAVEFAETHLENGNINAAKADHDRAKTMVEALEDGDVKTDLLARLAVVEAGVEKGVAEYTATQKVKLAEENAKTGSYDAALTRHNEALVLVNALEDGDVKTALLDRLAKVEEAINNYNEAKKVQDMIAAIPADSKLTLEDTTVEAARTAFEALTEAQQALVNNVNRLEAKEAYMAQKAADNVYVLIQALPDAAIDASLITIPQGKLIEAAKGAYDALSDAAKAKVPAASLSKLNTLLGKI